MPLWAHHAQRALRDSGACMVPPMAAYACTQLEPPTVSAELSSMPPRCLHIPRSARRQSGRAATACSSSHACFGMERHPTVLPCPQSCSLRQAEAGARGMLACGKVCQLPLPACSHLCQSTCHAGACPGPCAQPVTVRCDCRRRRSKLPCHEARAQLAAAGRDASLDASAAVRLLACDAECSRLKVWRPPGATEALHEQFALACARMHIQTLTLPEDLQLPACRLNVQAQL